VVLELADLLHAPEEEVAAHKELISNQSAAPNAFTAQQSS